LSECWICGSSDSREVVPSGIDGGVSSEDFRISDSHYGRTARIVECNECGFRYADPLPADDLAELYSRLTDEDYDSGSEGRIEPFRKILDTALRLRQGIKSVLDIGASTGLMCLAAGEKGLDAVGVEPSRWAVDIAVGRHGVNVIEGVYPHPELVGRKFDLVTLVDVIEHVTDPVGLLKDAAGALTDDGLCVVVTPDVGSMAARIMGRRWWHYRVAHVCYFNRRTMKRALGMAGLAVVKIQGYSWTFSLGYLAERLSRYLPVGGLVKLVSSAGVGRKVMELRVPLNLGDSDVYYCGKQR